MVNRDMVDYIMQFYRNSWYNTFDWIIILIKEGELILYPYMALSDETQILHSQAQNQHWRCVLLTTAIFVLSSPEGEPEEHIRWVSGKH